MLVHVFTHSSWQTCSNLPKILVLFSELCLGYCNTFRFLLFYSRVPQARSLSGWKVNQTQIFCNWKRFSSLFTLDLSPIILPSSITSLCCQPMIHRGNVVLRIMTKGWVRHTKESSTCLPSLQQCLLSNSNWIFFFSLIHNPNFVECQFLSFELWNSPQLLHGLCYQLSR